MGCRLSGPWIGDGMMGVSGRDLSQLSQRDALRILAACERPVTVQIAGGQKGRCGGLQDCGTQTDRMWEPLPLSLHNLNLPLRSAARPIPRMNPAYQDRSFCSHLNLPQELVDNGRYEYLPNSPRDMDLMETMGYKDPELDNRRGPNCLMGCCNANLEENSFHSQAEDDDLMLEKPLGYLPLHHELDSGLGWTDGSLHQGDLSGLETGEEGGMEDCPAHGGGLAPGGVRGGGGSPSSESFMSSELSDSGFYSVSTGEFRRFQRLLEKRMRVYNNARPHHQGGEAACDRWEQRRDSCPKSHRELLEAIPEALTMQPQHRYPPPPNNGLFRVSSVQFRKADRPCLNRHSSSSGALFNPSQTHSPMVASVHSACSTPSGHRRPLALLQQQHQGSSSVGMLRRSRTLHHRAPLQEYRRRASHPASPSYCAATMHHCGDVLPPRGLELGLTEEGQPEPSLVLSHPGSLALSPQQHSTIVGQHWDSVPLPHGPCCDNNGQMAYYDKLQSQERSLREIERERQAQRERELEREQQIQEERAMERERQRELERGREREHQCFHRPVHPPQQGDIHETWPKPANRQSQANGGGLYSTLEAHIGGAGAPSIPGQAAKGAHQNPNPNVSLTAASNPQDVPGCVGANPAPSAARLSRSQLLRDRASRLADERSGMSTDEETNTDVLRGRYWSRTERREHLLLAREQRQQQQATRNGGAARDGGGLGGKGPTPGGGGAATPGGEGESLESRGSGHLAEGRGNTVLELSHRKLSRLQSRKFLDDWTTVEELLSHGTRLGSGDDMRCPSSLLTVTTV